MELGWQPIDLSLKDAFAIARSSRKTAENVIVCLEHEGIKGYGEAAPNSYYQQDQASALQALEQIAAQLGNDPSDIEEISAHLWHKFPDQLAAVAAVDMALYDWRGKKLGEPLWRTLGLDAATAPLTSFTIGIDSPARMVRKVREAADYPVLKLKVGTDDDEGILKAIRGETDKPLRVDANGAWKSEEAAAKIEALAKYDLEFVEQPLPPGNTEALRQLRGEAGVPIIADESVITPGDVPKMAGCVDGINIKLAKCGGITPALEMIRLARAAGLKVMLGCMIESSIGISAAAQLAPLADYADLDGNLLINNDPARGVEVEKGKLILKEAAGLGVELISDFGL